MQRATARPLVAFLVIAGSIRAQEPTPAELARQLEELRQRNEALEARVGALEAEGQAEEDQGSGLIARYGDVTATFQVFGDVGANYRNPAEDALGNSNFYLGSVDFFANVQFGDRFRILSESVLDARGGERFGVDQERLWAMWTVSDLLYVKLGTEHSPVSRWNQLYHHGRWLETSVSRPLLGRFEGDDAILAMHTTGLEFGGREQTDLGGLDWFLSISNGRGLQPTNKQRSEDKNDGKKIDVGVAFSPNAVRDLRVGTAFTYDEIPPDPSVATPGRARGMREFVAAANTQYRLGPFDLLAEYVWIEHTARDVLAPATYHHNAAYAQVAWRAGQLTPFARMDYRNMERNDPFYVPSGRDLDILRPIVGVRYDASDNIAAKLEFAWERQERPGFGLRDRDVLSVAFQVSWVL